MLIKSITESNVSNSTSELCKQMDPGIFQSFKRYSAPGAFGVESITNSANISASSQTEFPNSDKIKPKDMSAHIEKCKEWFET